MHMQSQFCVICSVADRRIFSHFGTLVVLSKRVMKTIQFSGGFH